MRALRSRAALALVTVGVLALAPAALAAVPASAAPAAPRHCVDGNKVFSSRAHLIGVAWLPTSWSSRFIAGPASITRTSSISSTVTATISATFGVDEGLLFVSAHETYGISLASSREHSATVSYTLTVPSGKTEKMQEFKEGYELGIVQKKYNDTCTKVITYTSRSGNYFPVVSNSESTYCMAGTTLHRARIEVRYTCGNQT